MFILHYNMIVKYVLSYNICHFYCLVIDVVSLRINNKETSNNSKTKIV